MYHNTLAPTPYIKTNDIASKIHVDVRKTTCTFKSRSVKSKITIFSDVHHYDTHNNEIEDHNIFLRVVSNIHVDFRTSTSANQIMGKFKSSALRNIENFQNRWNSHWERCISNRTQSQIILLPLFTKNHLYALRAPLMTNNGDAWTNPQISI